MSKIASWIRSHWYLPLTMLLALIGVIVKTPSGEDIVNLGWDTFFTTILIMLAYTGLDKERALAPLKAFLSALRFTVSILITASLASFVLGAVIGGYAAAIMMVPITLSVLKGAEREGFSARAAALVTASAVLGSMALPSGSIANTYLAPRMEGSFISVMLPLSAAGLALACILPFALMGRRIKDEVFIHSDVDKEGSKSMRMLYVCLMIIAALTALGSFMWLDILILFLFVLIIFDRKVFLRVNWAIPLSFLFLSIFASSLGLGLDEPWTIAAASEIAGSTASSLSLSLPASAEAVRAVNIGGLGLLTGMAALGVAGRMGKGWKGFALCYLLVSIPSAAVLALVSALL